MKRKELTKTDMMISNCKKIVGLHGLYGSISALISEVNLLDTQDAVRHCITSLKTDLIPYI